MMDFVIDQSVAGLPYIEQYHGVWSIDERSANAFIRLVEYTQINVHLNKQQQREKAPIVTESFQITPEGIAIIPIHGVIMKQESSMTESASTVAIRRQIRSAMNTESVNGILLHIDSPGGTVAGTADLADDIYEAGKRKPVVAFIEDLGASAAYKIASQAGRIVANQRETIVGSLGTFMVVYDLSKQAEQEGVKVHVIKSGEFKGAGTPGTKITDEQIAEWQREIDDLSSAFERIISRGRGDKIRDIRQLFDGRVHPADVAVSLGLIDAVDTLDNTLAAMTQSTTETQNGDDPTMAETKTKAASVDELKKHCVGSESDPAFLVEMIGAESSVADAQKAWAAKQQEEIRRLREERDAAAKERDEAKSKAASRRTGVDPLTTESGAGDDCADSIETWHLELQKKLERGLTRQQAVSRLAKEKPQLHEQYIAAANSR